MTPELPAAPASAGAVRFARRLAGGCFAGAVLIDAVGADAATRDRPPTAVTGGFGEPTCQMCHFEAEVNAGKGSLTIDGVPASYAEGENYTLTLTLVQTGTTAAGFEIAARFENGGAQAGSLAAGPADKERVEISTDAGIQYGHHLRPGTNPVAPDTARWQLVWTAPTGDGGTVAFHAVANAANNDDSPLGDFIYTASASSRRR